MVYVVSDSLGETAEIVVRAAASQFSTPVKIRRFPFVVDVGTIGEIVQSAKEMNAMIAFTIVIPHLKEHLLERCREEGIPVVDIMGPMIAALTALTQEEPRYEAGLIHRLDEEYFKKIEAIEFAVKYDDGKDARGILHADIVLIGVSRTSKTPLSMYLAHKRVKVANVPLVPEVEPPRELFQISPGRCIGLIIDPVQLNIIRTERLKSLGLDAQAKYASLDRIKQELEYSEQIFKKIGCPVINVTNKAVEETANLILNMFRNGKIR